MTIVLPKGRCNEVVGIVIPIAWDRTRYGDRERSQTSG